MDEMIKHFNDVVSAMSISIKDKMTILGLITAIGYKYQDDCKTYQDIIETDRDEIQWLKKCVNDLSAASVRPVVLCKDCEYCRRVDEFEYWCDGFCSPARLVRKDDFCSHGKAKE